MAMQSLLFLSFGPLIDSSITFTLQLSVHIRPTSNQFTWLWVWLHFLRLYFHFYPHLLAESPPPLSRIPIVIAIAVQVPVAAAYFPSYISLQLRRLELVYYFSCVWLWVLRSIYLWPCGLCPSRSGSISAPSSTRISWAGKSRSLQSPRRCKCTVTIA